MSRVGVVLALMAVLVGCGTQPARTPTAAEAAREVEAVARSVPGTLGPFTDRLASEIDSSECEDPDDGGPRGRVSVGGSWSLVPAPPIARVRDLMGRLATAYTANGWVLLYDRRNQPAPSLGVERISDGVRIALQGGYADGIGYSVGSACVWPNGVPPGS